MQPLTIEEMGRIELPKWPGLLVVGDPIDRERAAEILVRTDSFTFRTNNEDWRRQVHEATGIPYVSSWGLGRYDFPSIDRARKRFNALRLGILDTNWIASNYIGGPHGWVDWSGRVGCNSFNIGKDPDTVNVFFELSMIARAWSFLTFRCQLLNHEAGYPNPEGWSGPLIEYLVQDGKVQAFQPEHQIVQDVEDPNFSFEVDLVREAGCTIEQLRHALELAERASPLPDSEVQALEKLCGYVE